MNKFILTVLATVVALSANAQLTTRSISTDVSNERFSLLYLRDGFDNFAAFEVPLHTIADTDGRLRLTSFGAYNPSDVTRQVYIGTGISADLLRWRGATVTGIVGWKGFDLANNFRAQEGRAALVFGFGLSVPLR